METIFYERRVYESVDDESLSCVKEYPKSEENRTQAVKNYFYFMSL